MMSFCAVIAIKVYSPVISKVILNLHFGEKLASLLSSVFSASIGMIPFWSDISMKPGVEYPVVQITGSLFAGAACTFFIPCVLLCLIFPFWSQYLSAPLNLCLKALSYVVSIGSSISAKSGPPVHLSQSLLFAIAAVIFLLMLPPCLFKRNFLKIASLVLALIIGLEAFRILDKPSCRVVFADVGQGDCCLIITSSKTCLIDAGTYEEGDSAVSDLLDYYGISQVDFCIMSHWDADHAGGFAALCRQGRIGTVFTSYVPSSDDDDKDVKDFFKVSGLNDMEKVEFVSHLQPALAGDSIVLSDSVFVDFLYPSDMIGGGNESSLLAMLHIIDGECEDGSFSEDIKILFTGDIGTKTESVLIEEGIDLDCNILKVAHHGSKYSSSADFLEASSPNIAVISVGAHNFYGHPSPDTLERLESCGCEVFRTDKEGAVVLEY